MDTDTETVILLGLLLVGGYVLGIIGFFRANSAHTELRSLRRVLAGRIYMSEAFSKDLASRFVDGKGKCQSLLASLSDRELQVFRLIGEGRRTREIAPILNLSPKTIESYREHLKQKLDIDGSPQLVQRAVRFVETGEIH